MVVKNLNEFLNVYIDILKNPILTLPAGYILGFFTPFLKNILLDNFYTPWRNFSQKRQEIFRKITFDSNLITNFPVYKQGDNNNYVYDQWVEARPGYRDLATDLSMIEDCQFNFLHRLMLRFNKYKLHAAKQALYGLSNSEGREPILNDSELRSALCFKGELKESSKTHHVKMLNLGK